MQPLRQHTFALAVVLAIFAAFGTQSFMRAKLATEGARETVRAEMGVEHTQSLSLMMDISALQGLGLLDLSHEGEETILISLPSLWQRKEVRNVPLSEVTEESTSFGFTRWKFPQGASVTFAIPEYPDSLLLHNPSGVPLKVNITRVDLDRSTVEKDVVLIQESTVSLW